MTTEQMDSLRWYIAVVGDSHGNYVRCLPIEAISPNDVILQVAEKYEQEKLHRMVLDVVFCGTNKPSMIQFTE